MVELMSPAGNWESLNAAIAAGADSVYFGVKTLSMRARARNFELNEIPKIINFCHIKKVKAYLTLNTIIYDDEINKLKKILNFAKGIDGIICWDLAVIKLAKEKGYPIIISTQASISNIESCNAYQDLGAKRVVLARECTLEQIQNIKKNTNLEIEVFAHGAMCVSISGRCFISQFQFGKSANRGECLQPCRRTYQIKEPEEGNELELGQNYLMSPKDLITLPFIDKIIQSGVNCIKIEGRARSPEYVKVVTECYREAIDAHYKQKLTDELKKELIEKIKTVYNRGFSSGFLFGKPINEWTDAYGSKATTKKIYLGKVTKFYQKINVAEIFLESGEIIKGEKIQIHGPTTGVLDFIVESIQDHGKSVEKGRKRTSIGIKVPNTVRPNDKLFSIIKIK